MKDFNARIERDKIIAYLGGWFEARGPQSKAIIGISGGKDSTIAAALAVRALGKNRVVGVIMPNGEMYDINDAIQVCQVLGIEYKIINIKSSFDATIENLTKAGCNINYDVRVNTAPRERMKYLYAVCASQTVPSAVINTCNRSEDYVGYSTKFGDSAGDISVLQDLLVSEVLAIGDLLEEIPYELVHKTPSDGLCGKSDEDNLGYTYNQLDTYIRYKEDESITEDEFNAVVPDDIAYKIKKRHKANLHKIEPMPSYARRKD